MARSKTPKKVNGENVTVPATSHTPAPQNGAAGETGFTASAMQGMQDTEVRNPSRKIARRPEIVKSDSRATLLPINLDDEIRQLAYLLSERRGFEPGHETEDWLNAEREIRQRYHQYSA
jgi:hypothetical protein